MFGWLADSVRIIRIYHVVFIHIRDCTIYSIRNRERWNWVEEQLWQSSLNFRLGISDRFGLILAALSITALLEGRVVALKKLIEIILGNQNLKINASSIGESLFNKGWYKNLSGFTLGEIVDPNSVIKNLGDNKGGTVKRILEIFAFESNQPGDWLAEVADGIVLPMMKFS